MPQTFFVTAYQSGLLTGTIEDGRLNRASFFHEKNKSILGNIYVAKVIDVVKNINACFVEIAPGLKCFLPLDTCKNAILCNRAFDGRILAQDTIVVMVEKDAAKSKDPYVSAKLTLTGDFCVCLTDRPGIQYSRKFTDKQKAQIKQELEGFFKDPSLAFAEELGFIIRTDALHSGEHFEGLKQELRSLSEKMQEILTYASKRTIYSVLFKREELYIEELKKWGVGNFDKITTDISDVYENITCFLSKNNTSELSKCQLYQDETITLSNLYNLRARMEESLNRKVWLKCGGNLVIDELEAMTVIDINTAKSSAMKSSEENFYKVNREACEEIARQLILRNLSGMIMIDFINLKSKDKEKEIMDYLQSLLKRDAVTAKVVDMTALGIVEVTRKRTYPSLKEQFGGYEKF